MSDGSPTEATERERTSRKWRLLLLLAVGALVTVALLAVWRMGPPRVEVFHPRSELVAQTLTASGQVKGVREVDLSVERGGILVQVLVGEGDEVTSGQVVAVLADEVEAAQVEQAQAAIRTAQARLAEATASATSLPSTIRQTRAEVEGQTRQAEQRLHAARARLAELERGVRPQETQAARAAVDAAALRVDQSERDAQRVAELADADATATAAVQQADAAVRQAQAQVGEARAARERADADAQRLSGLLQEGAVSQSEYEKAQTAQATARERLEQAEAGLTRARVEADNQRKLLEVNRRATLERRNSELDVARKDHEAAMARLALLESGTRSEQIVQQQAEVDSARAGLETAHRAGPARIETVQRTPVSERIALARSQLEEATRARDAVLAQLKTRQVTARFGGIVTEVAVHPGDVVNPGQPVMRVSDMTSAEIHVDIDERDIAWVEIGQQAVVITDAYPDRPFDARVMRIAPRTVTARGAVEVVAVPDKSVEWIREGMTADISIFVAPQEQLLVLPATALVQSRDMAYAMVVQQDQVRRRDLKLGMIGREGVVILDGLSENDLVVARPLSVQDGMSVRTRMTELSGLQDAF